MDTKELAIILAAILLVIAAACSSGGDSEGSPTAVATQTGGSSADTTTPASSGSTSGSVPAAERSTEPTAAVQSSQSTQGEEEFQMVEVAVGQQYQGGTRVSFAEFGVSILIPDGWQGTLPQGSPAFVMQSSTRPEQAVLVVSQSASTTDEMIGELHQPVPLDENVFMTAQGQPQVDGQWVTSRVSASDGANTLEGYITGLARDGGNGVAFIGLGPQGDAEFFRLLVGGLAANTKTFEPAKSSSQASSASSDPGDTSQLAKEWTQHFNGMRLTYISSYSSGSSGGTSTKYEYDLCSDGRFAYSDSSSLSLNTDGASAFQNAQGGGGGQWNIITEGDRAGIEFRYSDGTVSQRLLEFVDGKTQLDGDRWFVTPDNSFCQ